MKRALSPCQISRAGLSGTRQEVQGRAFALGRSAKPREPDPGQQVELGRTFALCDAEVTIQVVLGADPHEKLHAGDYALVEGALADGAFGLTLVDGRLQKVWPAPIPSSHSDFWRFRDGSAASAPEHHRKLGGQVLRQRARCHQAVRRLFEEAGFLEVDTPERVVSPGSDAYVNAFSSEDRFLITSPEHHMKRLVAAGFHHIFQLSHCFRKDEYGPWHLPEFTMLEWYRAFAGAEAVMLDTEDVVLTVLNEFRDSGGHDRLQGFDLSRPFDRLTMRDAFREFADINDAIELAHADEDQYFQVFVDRVEPGLARLTRPVFLCEFPASQAALATTNPTDPSVAERFELYLSGVELCNGYTELTSASELVRREAEEQKRRRLRGEPEYPADPGLYQALLDGFPPCGGNALGLDRLLALALGVRDIRQVVPFPS